MRLLILVALFSLCFQNAFSAQNTIDYHVGDESFQGYYVSPGKHAPLVVLIHDWDGLTEYEIQRAHMLVANGYQVFILDLFGKGVRPVSIEEKRKLTGELYKDRKRMRELLKGGLMAAADQGADVENSVVAGYCFGGAAALEFARSGADLKGFVSFHGGLSTPEDQDYSMVKGTILILHGTADRAVSMDEFAELAEALEEAGVPHEMITYSGAPHAFTVFGSPRYHEDADRKSWTRFLNYLESSLQ